MSVNNDILNTLSDLDREALAWIERVILRNATVEELEALAQWRDQSAAHAAAYDVAIRLRRTVNAYPKGSAEHFRAAFLTQAATRRALLGGAAAAAAAGYIGVRPPLNLWPSFAELTSDFRTGVGERRKLALAPGVSVEMSARTSLSLRASVSDPGFELVRGEVAVSTQLASNRSFHIIAGSGAVVTGTADIDMQNDDGAVRITCLNGVADIRHPSGRLWLRKDQQVRYSGNSLSEAHLVDPMLVTAWRRGLLIFRQTRLEQVVAEINRYRSGKIILMNSALADRRFSGAVRIDRVEEMVSQIQKVANVSAVALPGGIVLLS